MRGSESPVSSGFILPSFLSSSEPSTDEPDRLVTIRVDDHDKATIVGLPDENKPMFATGMVGVVNGDREWIAKGSGGVIEGNTMLCQVALCLGCIPLKPHDGRSVQVPGNQDKRTQRAPNN